MKMKLREFRKLIREEIRKVVKEANWSDLNDADKLPAKVVISSDYDGEWMDTAPDTWMDDFEAVQNQLYKKFKDGKDFGLMSGMGDDVFNALFVVNPAVLQDPIIAKYLKKIMSYGGLEVEKGKF